ncbi:MAG: SRPBCC family protein [Kineosporiaceae bacterium]
MSSIIETVDVTAPVRAAYDQWTQFEEFPQFMEGVEEIRQTDATHNHWTINIGGVRREFDAEITEQHPDERIAWRSVNGTDHAGVVTFHRLDDEHTRVTLQLDTAPEGLVENLGDKLGLVSHRAKGDMKRFKEYIEQRGEATDGWRGDVPRPDQRDGETTSSGLAASSAAATAGASGYPLAGDPYTEEDTYSTALDSPVESSRDLGSGSGRHAATSQDSDPFAGIASSTATGSGYGGAVGEGAVTGPYADAPGGAPVYDTDADAGVDAFTDADPAVSTDDDGTPTGYADPETNLGGIYDPPVVDGESPRPRDPRINPL